LLHQQQICSKISRPDCAMRDMRGHAAVSITGRSSHTIAAILASLFEPPLGFTQQFVIPGLSAAKRPESIFQRPVFMGSGCAACGVAPE